ncbi:MAG: 50S ribosomal protein L37ae [Candidatus Altiarchaeota archaeon]|nr:50S ribosomal protein L37ae [Candidatus Altiarchaeota archaeon]
MAEQKNYAGKFGPRYGRKIRARYAEIEANQRKDHECPSCGESAVKRVSSGVYKCKKCNTKFTSGAYVP